LSAILAAGEAPSVRELVDRLRDLEGEVALIERESALPADRARMWSGAARGMIEAVDPWGGYLDADEVAIYGLGSEPMAVGCGFDWRHEADGRLLVSRIVPGSPAARAGLHPGAEILAVNTLEPARASRRQIAEALARSGDTVRLRVRLADGRDSETSLTRGEIADDGLAAAWSEGRIGVLRIGRFLPARTGEDATATATGVRAALTRLGEIQALVLDLRGCAGGNLQAAVELAAAWIPAEATVAIQIGRDPARGRNLTATSARLPSLPLVLLVDGGTASSAEVLAHALHHHCRAPVVGSATLGKGTVQQLFLLPRGDALRLTVARLQAPNGAWLDQPLQPDIAVPQAPAVTMRRWQAELNPSATPLPPDPQMERATEIARALVVQTR
jgi:carboxyl-terminal processing protease